MQKFLQSYGYMPELKFYCNLSGPCSCFIENPHWSIHQDIAMLKTLLLQPGLQGWNKLKIFLTNRSENQIKKRCQKLFGFMTDDNRYTCFKLEEQRIKLYIERIQDFARNYKQCCKKQRKKIQKTLTKKKQLLYRLAQLKRSKNYKFMEFKQLINEISLQLEPEQLQTQHKYTRQKNNKGQASRNLAWQSDDSCQADFMKKLNKKMEEMNQEEGNYHYEYEQVGEYELNKQQPSHTHQVQKLNDMTQEFIKGDAYETEQRDQIEEMKLADQPQQIDSKGIYYYVVGDKTQVIQQNNQMIDENNCLVPDLPVELKDQQNKSYNYADLQLDPHNLSIPQYSKPLSYSDLSLEQPQIQYNYTQTHLNQFEQEQVNFFDINNCTLGQHRNIYPHLQYNLDEQPKRYVLIDNAQQPRSYPLKKSKLLTFPNFENFCKLYDRKKKKSLVL